MRARSMRCRVTIAMVVAVTVAATATVGCSSRSTPESASAPDADAAGYPERTATIGAVDVKVRPVALGADGAAFTLVFDSHAASFDADPVAVVTLEVGGIRWSAVGWEGQPPAGHHREGTLRFTATGPATGTATLAVGGLVGPVEFTWQIQGG